MLHAAKHAEKASYDASNDGALAARKAGWRRHVILPAAALLATVLSAGPCFANTFKPAPSAPTPGKATGPGTTYAGSVKAVLGKPDLMATPLGMSLAGGVHAWGSTVVLTNPNSASAKGLGPHGNLCRFSPVAFRPFNKGTVASGPFLARVYRGNALIHATLFNLPAKSGLPGNGWHTFNLTMAKGMNKIKVVLDPNKVIAESNEGNNVYSLRVRVKFPCGKASKKILPARKR